ncbi:hypothetical protein [Mycolicibacter minnesotensis]
MKILSRFTLAGLAILLGVGVVVLYKSIAGDGYATHRNPYTAEHQQQRAHALIDGLNSRDPEQVELFSVNDDEAAPARARIARNIKAAMPNPGCRYVLDSVHDRGEQGRQNVGWLGTTEQQRYLTYRYDLLITEVCPKAKPIPLRIGVTAIYGDGDWADAALSVEQ